jgi:hypothetical protein
MLCGVPLRTCTPTKKHKQSWKDPRLYQKLPGSPRAWWTPLGFRRVASLPLFQEEEGCSECPARLTRPLVL